MSCLFSVRAALVSVGGTAEPVLYVLGNSKPAHVWYFCSADSRGQAEQIHRQLGWHPHADFIEVERFEELGPCYRALRLEIPRLLKQWHVQPAEVLVDYTGGTKPMSAALVLAASELFQHFSYVGGRQRLKSGLGIVVSGQERQYYQANPWSELAVREVERAADLWNHGLYEGAAQVLARTAEQVPRQLLFKALAGIASATAARHHLRFGQAQVAFGQMQKSLPGLLDGREDYGLLSYVADALATCSGCARGEAGDVLLREILDNALRTAAQQRYEDAAARLYRAMEMQAQLWLAEASEGRFLNGRLRKDKDLPGALADWEHCRRDERREVKLSLELCLQAAERLGHSRTRLIVEDLGKEERSRWRQATEKRNVSVLAHGVKSIDAEAFEEMKSIAIEFLGFNLTAPVHAIPRFDPRWAVALG